MTTPADAPTGTLVFYCPIPFQDTPHAAAADVATVAWLDRFGMYRSRTQRDYLARSKLGVLSAWAYADAPADGMQVAVDAETWIFTFDDAYADENPEGVDADALIPLCAKMARIAETPEADLLPGDPWAEGLRDLRRRVDAIATPVQADRWARELRFYLQHLAWEAVTRRSGTVMPLSDYVLMWLDVVGLYPAFALIDVAAGYEVPSEQRHHPEVRALGEMACAVLGWDNDIVSYHKETARADHYGHASPLNLVSVLAAERGAGPAEAMREALAMRDTVLRLFLGTRERVLRDASPELARYVDGLARWIRANLEWSTICSRYGDPFDPGDGDGRASEPILRIRTEPDDGPGDHGPLSLPSVSWWWGMSGRTS